MTEVTDAPKRRTRKKAPEAVVEATEPGSADTMVFVAARPMKRNGVSIKIGDVIEDAASWPRLESWVRAGYLKEA